MSNQKDVSINEYHPHRLINAHFKTPIPVVFNGMVYCWDIDKTYLDTKFDKLGELLKIPWETAWDKKNVPGSAALLKGLQKGTPLPDQNNYIFFVSASPNQLRGVIEKKMELDGIDFAGTIFKNQLYNIRKGQFKQLKHQLGYKLSAILNNKNYFQFAHAKEIFFGDSRESDILVYSVYNQIISGQLSGERLQKVLNQLELLSPEVDYILDQIRHIPMPFFKKVQPFYILLVKEHTPTELKLMAQFPHCILVHNYFEAAIHLFQNNLVSHQTVINVGRQLVESFDYSPSQLANSISYVLKKGYVHLGTIRQVKADLESNLVIDREFFKKNPTHFWAVLINRIEQIKQRLRFKVKGRGKRWNPIKLYAKFMALHMIQKPD